jgi:hypothetical protein
MVITCLLMRALPIAGMMSFYGCRCWSNLREPSDTIADLINKVETTTDRYLLYATSIYRGGHGNGGPLWADQKETAFDMLHRYHQVVGHTQIPEAQTISFTGRSVTYVDVLWNQTYFHELDL